VGPRNHVLGGSLDLSRNGQFLKGRGAPLRCSLLSSRTEQGAVMQIYITAVTHCTVQCKLHQAYGTNERFAICQCYTLHKRCVNLNAVNSNSKLYTG